MDRLNNFMEGTTWNPFDPNLKDILKHINPTVSNRGVIARANIPFRIVRVPTNAIEALEAKQYCKNGQWLENKFSFSVLHYLPNGDLYDVYYTDLPGKFGKQLVSLPIKAFRWGGVSLNKNQSMIVLVTSFDVKRVEARLGWTLLNDGNFRNIEELEEVGHDSKT